MLSPGPQPVPTATLTTGLRIRRGGMRKVGAFLIPPVLAIIVPESFESLEKRERLLLARLYEA
jgi:hypothetical protein